MVQDVISASIQRVDIADHGGISRVIGGAHGLHFASMLEVHGRGCGVMLKELLSVLELLLLLGEHGEHVPFGPAHHVTGGHLGRGAVASMDHTIRPRRCHLLATSLRHF